MQTLLTFASVALLAMGCTKETRQAQDEPLTDEALQRIVKTRLQSDASVGRLNLEVAADTEHRAIKLQGIAYTQLQRTRAVELARGARADSAVQDDIEVRPYEIPRDLFDDDMMSEARADASKMGDELGNTLDDGWLHMKVVARLLADSGTAERSINVDVSDRVVTLRGTVPNRESRAQVERIAKSVEGVKDVSNRLVVKP